MPDNDIMGTDNEVALTFQNATVDSARKMLQKVMLILFTPAGGPYGTNFYENIKNASASDPDRLNSFLSSALGDVRSYLTAFAQDGDPAVLSLVGNIQNLESGVAEAEVQLTLVDGSFASTTVQLGEAT